MPDTETVVVKGLFANKPVQTEFTYVSSSPYEVHADFQTKTQRVTWSFSREILVEALDPESVGMVGDGDVRFTKDNRFLHMKLQTNKDSATLSFPLSAISRFVARTTEIVPIGEESEHLFIPDTLESLF